MLATKTVTTTSGDFTIAPLTLRQVETMFPGDRGPTRMDLILMSLHNAGSTVEADALKDQLSPRSIVELVEAVMTLTGLDFQPAGEATAAETPGPTSTAA